MITSDVKVYAENRFAYDGVAFYVMGREKGSRLVAELFYKDVSENTVPPESFSLTRDNTQALMDTLWQCGFRPTEAMGSAGALSATQAHVSTLKDVSDRLLKIVESK